MEIDHEEEGGVLQGEGLPTSTGGLGLRVVEHEASLEVIFHVVHLGSDDVQEGFGSHKNFHACFRRNHHSPLARSMMRNPRGGGSTIRFNNFVRPLLFLGVVEGEGVAAAASRLDIQSDTFVFVLRSAHERMEPRNSCRRERDGRLGRESAGEWLSHYTDCARDRHL